MFRMLRPAAVALLGLLILTSPAAALSWGANAFTGKVGAIAGPTRPEAVCRYNGSGSLKSITIKAPIVHGSHDELTTVGWTYEIRRGVPFHRGDLIYRSKTFKTQASETVASAFGKKTYYILRDMPDTFVVDRVPPTYDTWPAEAKTARIVYVRAQYYHMPLVTAGVVLPSVLRLLAVELLADEPWQHPLGALPPVPDAGVIVGDAPNG